MGINLGPLSSSTKKPRDLSAGDVVTVWFDNPPVKLEGVIVRVIVPGDALRVRLTTSGELGKDWNHMVGEEHDMWRITDLANARYDDYFWSPVDEEVT